MTREEHKEYNAVNYPASVLRWLNKTVDRVCDDLESRTCKNCRHFKVYSKEKSSGDCTDESSIAFENGKAIYEDDGCNHWSGKS
ncbi:MAG: hypothetical protein PHW89_08030 [Sulfurimonas denitrificans]|nr:hypothetical protein [Sulfurimonas denitrificans]